MQFKKLPDTPGPVGREFVPKRVFAPAKKAAQPPKVSRVFSLFLAGSGEHLHASPAYLPKDELARLNRALAHSFGAIYRMPALGVTQADFSPGIASWLTLNDLHFSLGAGLLRLTRHFLRDARKAGDGLPCLTFIDAPMMARCPYEGTEEQAIRKALQAAGWMTLVTRRPVLTRTPVASVAKPQGRASIVFRKLRGDD